MKVAHAWQVLHPPVQPHHAGWLDVGDGHALHYSVAGHPAATPVLVLHGGPGAGCSDACRRWFDARRWRIVLLDQRGCGRSRAACALQANTTAHLLDDIERLRRHLGVERWWLFGGSWGATLALASAGRDPRAVIGLVLRAPFIADDAAAAALYGPQRAAWFDALHERLAAGDADAAAHWWRHEHDRMDDAASTPARPPAPATLLRQARIGVHYARQRWFLREGELLAGAQRLAATPGVVVQGSRDRVTPARCSRALREAWPRARWIDVPGAGHASTHPALAAALVRAIDEIASDNDTAGDRPWPITTPRHRAAAS